MASKKKSEELEPPPAPAAEPDLVAHVDRADLVEGTVGEEEAGETESARAQLADAQLMEAQLTDAGLDVAEITEQRPAVDETDALKPILEAIIYITDEPLSAQQIAAALEKPIDVVQRLLGELVTEYAKTEHGLGVREIAGGYKMATKAEHHEAVRAFVKKLTPPLKLSLAALETLAVIAYKQPVTAPEIMEIRGVQGASVLKTLLDRKLVTEAGRKAVVGKPILYKTTKDFLVQFGLKSLSELPTLKEFEELARMSVGGEEAEEETASSEGELADASRSEEEKTELPGSQGQAEERQAPAEQTEQVPAEHRDSREQAQHLQEEESLRQEVRPEAGAEAASEAKANDA